MRRRAGFALLFALSFMALPMAAMAEEPEPETEVAAEAETEGEELEEFDPIAIPYGQEGAWDEVAMTNDDAVKTGINVRATADEEGEVIGFLYRGGAAWVLNKGEEWTELCSGDLTGFVKNEYLLYGRDVTGLAEHYGREGVATTWDEVKLFASEDGSTDANVVAVLKTGDAFPLVNDNGHWLEVQYRADETAFVSEDDVVRVLLLDTASYKDGVYRGQADLDGEADEEESYEEESYEEEYYEEAPQTEPVRTETPQTEPVWTPPQTEAPAETPVTEAPAETPQTEAPAETPVTEAPAAETPQTEAPAETPVTEAPAAETPQTEAPAETPVTEAPVETPQTEAPAETPQTEAPAAEEPQPEEPADEPSDSEDEGDLGAEGYYDADTDTYYDADGNVVEQSLDAQPEEALSEEEYYDAEADTEVYYEESPAEETTAEETGNEEEASVEEASYEESSYEEATYEESAYEESSYEDASSEESTYGEASAETAEAYVEETEAASPATDDTALLAALIYCEAGNQSYDGMVAVGAVVMNRVYSSSFPNSISEVIYQSGQFTPASSGALASAVANGVPSTCYEAAAAAMGGENPVGNALFFNAGSGTGQQIGDHQFY